MGPNGRIVLGERQEMPGIQELLGLLELAAMKGERLVAVKLDYKAAFKRVKVDEFSSRHLCFKVAGEWKR